jgi:5-methylcytosine-specific restriction endonuclease McrA
LGGSLLDGSSKSCGCNNKYHGLKHGLSYTSEYNRARHSKRKAHKLRNGGSHSAEQVLNLLKKQLDRCHYCGEKLTEWHQEHKTPLSRGGTDNIENIVVSCPSCNWRKRDKTEEEFYAFLSDTKTPTKIMAGSVGVPFVGGKDKNDGISKGLCIMCVVQRLPGEGDPW